MTNVLAKGKNEISVFRVFGGDARVDGFSWTPVDPKSVSNFRNAAGLPSGGASSMGVATQNTYGMRFYGGGATESGRYLFPTFTG